MPRCGLRRSPSIASTCPGARESLSPDRSCWSRPPAALVISQPASVPVIGWCWPTHRGWSSWFPCWLSGWPEGSSSPRGPPSPIGRESGSRGSFAQAVPRSCWEIRFCCRGSSKWPCFSMSRRPVSSRGPRPNCPLSIQVQKRSHWSSSPPARPRLPGVCASRAVNSRPISIRSRAPAPSTSVRWPFPGCRITTTWASSG